MQAYRIRRGANERLVGDADALIALAAAGGVRETDEIESDAGWVAAGKHPLLRGRLGGDDPWAAWSDVDSVDAASLYKKMVDEPEDVPLESIVPVPAEIAPLPPDALAEPEPEALTDASVTPVPAPPPAERAPVAPRAAGATVPRREALPLPAHRPERPPPLPEESGELIDFPPRARPAMNPMDAFPRPARGRGGPPPVVRTARVVAMVVAGMLAVLLGYAWMRMAAYSRAGVSDAPPPRAQPVPDAPSPFALLDAELRSGLSATPRAIAADGDLSNALLVELVQQRLDVEDARGDVTKWIGRAGDEPRVAEVRIRYRSAGDISRELAAIALVVGRYKRIYRLEMPVFEVTELTTNGVTNIDPNRAEAYYQARLSLEDLLASIAGKR